MSEAGLRVPVLTYHAMNTVGTEYHDNDHVALFHDLRTIQGLGMKVVPLSWLVECLHGTRDSKDLQDSVVLTFDDGPNHDFIDWTHHLHGPLQSFYTIMREFHSSVGKEAQPHMQATSFVVASPEARRELDRTCMRGKGWWEDFWWKQAEETGLFSIQSHGWDHLHPTLENVAQKNNLKGDFAFVDNYEDSTAQVVKAADYIASVTGHRPTLFAYPWGQSSAYIRQQYLPEYGDEHGVLAAFSIEPRPVTRQESIWNLPRYVCGSNWRSVDELKAILKPCPV